MIRTLFETPLRDRPEPERTALLTGAAAPAGAMLLDGATPASDSATPVAHSLLWLCAGLARTRPPALIVDDAQWSDRCSLDVLSYLAGRIEDLPLLIVVAARLGDPRAPTDLLTLLGGARSSTVLHPQPLTAIGAVRLIRAVVPGARIETCTDFHRAASGNPWLLGELARRIETKDASPRAVVRRRLAELEPRDRAVAAARAVIGDDASPHAIARIAEVSLKELGAARDALTAAGLLNPDGDGIAHPLIAVAIADDLTPSERERLHRESARALIALGASSEEVGGHLLHCRPHGDPDVTAWLADAAADAFKRGAPGRAVAYLERALAERAAGDDRGKLLAEFAAAAFDAGMPDPRERLREALSEGLDRSSRLNALTRLAAYGVVYGDAAGDAGLLERELAAETAPEARIALEVALLDTLLTLPEHQSERARRVAEIAADENATTDPVVRRVVLAHRAWIATERGTLDAGECAAIAREALSGGFLLRHARQRAAYHLCVAVLVLTDHVEDARDAIAALRAEAMTHESVPLHAAVAAYTSELLLRTGHVREAETHARDALELAGLDLSAFAATATRVLAAALAERGAFDEARALLGAREEGRLVTRARLALAEGDFESAYADACDAGSRGTAALALAHLGRRDEAVTLAETELAMAERFGAPARIAAALLARAVAESDDQARVLICRRGLASLERRTGQARVGAPPARIGQVARPHGPAGSRPASCCAPRSPTPMRSGLRCSLRAPAGSWSPPACGRAARRSKARRR